MAHKDDYGPMRPMGPMGSEGYEEPEEEEPKKEKKTSKGNPNYRYDSNIPKNRRKTKIDKKEEGLVLTYPMLKKATLKKGEEGYDKDFKYKELCTDLNIDKKWQRNKCIKRIKAVYRKEHAILYTAECNTIRNPFKRKRCIAKYNRGL